MTQEPPKTDRNDSKRRTERITIRLTRKERQQIEDDAALMGITVGAYVRKVLLEAPVPRQSRRPSVETQTLAHLLGHIGKIGSNLNQLARAANTNIPYEQRALQSELEALKDIRKDIKKALGK